MANAKTKSGGKIPGGFVSPFKRVQMEGGNDDALAASQPLAAGPSPK
jgi:hypothetical protein